MGSFSEDDAEYRFFDAQENIAPVSDLCPGCSGSGVENQESRSFHYDVWTKSPRSVRERRRKFLQWMGLNLDWVTGEESVDLDGDMDSFGEQIDRVIDNSGAVLRNSIFEDEFSSSRSTVSSWSTNASSSARELGSNENFLCRCCNSDGARECSNNDLLDDGNLSKHEALGVSLFQRGQEFKESYAVPPSAQKFVEREIQADVHHVTIMEKLKNRWLRRMRSISCISGQHGIDDGIGTTTCNRVRGTRVQRVKVRQNRKQLKELSALFKGQDILAHDGAILTMKFSRDGQYLASAGEDKVVRIWQVVEDERANETDIPDIDPSCLYFTVNGLSELAPLMADKEKIGKSRSLRKTADSACIVFPPKVFRILEEPLHVFRGHTAEILDLSWSRNNVSSQGNYILILCC